MGTVRPHSKLDERLWAALRLMGGVSRIPFMGRVWVILSLADVGIGSFLATVPPGSDVPPTDGLRTSPAMTANVATPLSLTLISPIMTQKPSIWFIWPNHADRPTLSAVGGHPHAETDYGNLIR